MKTEQVLLSNQDAIIRRWMKLVQHDELIESSCKLSYAETRDSLPDILSAIARFLSEPDATKKASTTTIDLLKEALGHGKERARQGYDAEEIVWEYAILREVILQVLSEEVGLTDPVEIFALVKSVNVAVDKVVAYSMKRYADERLHELNVLYGELITSNQELDRIVRNEQSNLAHLAHELKSPLSSIIGYSDLFLRRHKNEAAVYPEYVEQVLTSGRRLLGTIDNALEMSSYRAGKVLLATQSVDACEVVSEVAAALRIMAQQKGLALEIDCDRTDTKLTTDKSRLRQVITNLLSNAIRYTESGSIHVKTHLVAGEDRIEIEVKDTGRGIDVAEQGLIFEPYYQGEAGQQLQSSTGLGLAITNQIVRLLNGSIQLKSEPKVGSTFTISLPLQLQLEPDLEKTALNTEAEKTTEPKPLEAEIAGTKLSPTRLPEPILIDSRSTSH